MEDSKIVDLYFERDERAIKETQLKYGAYLNAIANRIVDNTEDTLEIVNDSYLAAWNSIPPHRPQYLNTYIGKIVRRLSLNRYRENTALKRGNGEVALSYDELSEVIASDNTVEKEIDEIYLKDTINSFIEKLSKSDRMIFISRYYFFLSVDEIRDKYGFSLSKVKMSLKRSRDRLRKYLIIKGVNV